MAFAITQTCCNDASCVSVCPVNCIHPTPDEPDFGSTEMLYVDPQTCIDCGACADVCPVDAVLPLDRLQGPDAVYAELNAQYYENRPVGDIRQDRTWDEPRFPRPVPADLGRLRVAVVGTGPAASYTAQTLLMSTGAEVTMIDRLPVPGGLVRSGVAPDHPSTKRIGDEFAGVFDHPRLRVHMNVEVGTDLTDADLAEHHHAVVYAVGAPNDRTLGIPGEEWAMSATRFVEWYNAHPDAAGTRVDLSAERAVIVGNGNVALDVARILLADPDTLATTDIADPALAALRNSRVREVVVLARRGPAQAAYTRPELLALRHLPGTRLVVEDHPDARDAVANAAPGSKAAALVDAEFEQVDWTGPPPPGKRLVLAFFTAPVSIRGGERTESLRVTRNVVGADGAIEPTDEETEIDTGLVLRSIGYRVAAVPGLPFDEATMTVPHDGGRVRDPGGQQGGTYVVGWIKRGASGGIGTNRLDAAETVDSLLDDAMHHRLRIPARSARQFDRLVRRRKPSAIGRREMLAIDAAERQDGRDAGRPRVKRPTVPDLLAAARRRRR